MNTRKTFVFRLSRLVSAAVLLTLACFAFSPRLANAQGFLFEPAHPRPLPRIIHPPHVLFPAPREPVYSIESEEIVADVSGSVARVDVSQTFKNEGSSTIETAFVFPLPYDGAVDSMTLLVDGKETPAQLVDAEEARKQYEEIVRKARDPALLEWVGVGLFKTSVFPIPAGESRTVTMRYTQVLRAGAGLTEFFFPLSAAKYSSKPIKKISFDVSISGNSEIKTVYSPTFDLKIERPEKTKAKVSCVLENTVPSGDFRLFFDENADDLSAKVLSYRPVENEDGYFLLLASPKIADEGAKPLPRTIVFCLDVSGSMMGAKIEQARESMKFVISRLHDGDKFNVVLFGSDVVSFKDDLQVASAETRQEALGYVDGVRARGTTHIEGALKRAFSLLNGDDSSNLKYLIFVSDGEATVGETNEMKLAQIARENNKSAARFFSFGVGYDVNARLLDRFVRDGRGQGEYVKPEEKIEDRISAFYSRVDAPVFSDVEFSFSLKDATDKKYFVNQVYPSGKTDLFAGEKLVMAGRYSTPGEVKIQAKGKIGERDEEKNFEGVFTAKSEDSTNAFVERIWAARRIGEIIDELDLNGMNQELLDELVQLSKKHGVMTPYTSFLAREDVALNSAANNATARDNFHALASNTSGMGGVRQRSMKQGLKQVDNLNGAQFDSIAESNVMALADDSSSASSARMSGGMGGGMGGGRRVGVAGGRILAAPATLAKRALPMGAMGAAAPAPSPAPQIDEAVSNNIRVVADKTFYLRGGRWVDSSVTEEMEKNATPVEVKQFSDEYFKLIDENGSDLSRYLVFEESITINFKGKLYRIERVEE